MGMIDCAYCGGTKQLVSRDGVMIHDVCRHIMYMDNNHIHPTIMHDDECGDVCTIDCHDNDACVRDCDCAWCVMELDNN